MTSKKLDLLEQLKLQQKELTKEIELEIKQDLNQETHLLKYLQDVNGGNIQSTTCHINLIYEEIIELNLAIESSDFISITDLPKIRKESKIVNKRESIQKEAGCIEKAMRTIQHNRRQSGYSMEYDVGQRNIFDLQETEYTYKREKLLKDLLEIPKPTTEFTYSISSYHQRYTRAFIQPKNIVILALEIITLNLRKKKRLKEIFAEYYSKNFVEELLSKLYEKEIVLLESQINEKNTKNTKNTKNNPDGFTLPIKISTKISNFSFVKTDNISSNIKGSEYGAIRVNASAVEEKNMKRTMKAMCVHSVETPLLKPHQSLPTSQILDEHDSDDGNKYYIGSDGTRYDARTPYIVGNVSYFTTHLGTL